MNNFEQLQKTALEQWEMLQQSTDPIVYVGMGSCGLASGAGHVWNRLQKIREDSKYKFIAPSTFNINFPEELLNSFKNPTSIINKVKDTGRRAIERGARMLVPSCNVLNMVLIDANLRAIDGVTILDIAGTTLKVAEFMVDLEQAGISRSKSALCMPLSKDDILSIRNSYGIK